jgi:site-specific recombinase XerD
MANTAKNRGVFEKVPGSGIWWIRYQDSQGILRREKAGRQSDAIALVGKKRSETLQRLKLPENFRVNLTFNALCDDALEHCEASNTPKVMHDFELKVKELRPEFGEKRVSDITKQDIVRWLTEQGKKRKWAASTQNRWQAAFSLIFRVGIDNEKIERNPASGIRRKTENNARNRFLSDEEEASLRKVILARFPAMIQQLDLSLHTGMRAGEQFGLLWPQIDFEHKILTLPKTKNGRVRYIPLNAVALSALAVLNRTGDKTGPVFPSSRNFGNALQGARGWFRSALRDAKIDDYTWHCNRHTFASRLVMIGVDIRTVGELLGHRSLSMTMRYSHLAPAHNAAAVDRLVNIQGQNFFSEVTDTATDTSHLRVN